MKRFYIVHPFQINGGMGKRIELLCDVLRKKNEVKWIDRFSLFCKMLITNEFRSFDKVLFYSSLVVPCLLVLKILKPKVRQYYMVRGDEISYVLLRKRYFRAIVAFVLQYLAKRLGCNFIFVCKDLEVLFEKRYGTIKKKVVFPNTLGVKLPEINEVGNRTAIIGDFNSVKNIEWVLESLSSGRYEVHVYGNRSLPEKYNKAWVVSHGIVSDLTSEFKKCPALLVLPYTDAGFPNVINDALLAGCPSVVHDKFPFTYLPYSDNWRYVLTKKPSSNLVSFLDYLVTSKRDFKKDNPELISLIESSWEDRVREIFN